MKKVIFVCDECGKEMVFNVDSCPLARDTEIGVSIAGSGQYEYSVNIKDLHFCSDICQTDFISKKLDSIVSNIKDEYLPRLRGENNNGQNITFK